MAKLPGQFNAEKHDTMGEFSPIPVGDYLAEITKSTMETTKNGKGQYLKLEYKVLAGEHAGRVFWSNLNLVNDNAQTVEIAQKELATICKAAGKVVISDSGELHGIPMMVKLGIKKGDGQYLDQNTVKNYAVAEGVARPAAAVAHTAGNGGASKAKPWD